MRRILGLFLTWVLVACAVNSLGAPAALAAPTTQSTYRITGNGMVAVPPARLLDTRTGFDTVDNLFAGAGKVTAGTSAAVTVLGRGGVPDTGVAAVVLNVTGAGPTAPTYLTVFPSGETAPTASSLNLVTGETAANLAVVKVGANGQVNVFNASGATDVVLDVTGYFPSGDSFNAMSPQRLLDTRQASWATTVDGLFQGGGPVQAGSTLELQVTGRAGVPTTGVDAVVLNLTGIGTAPTFVTAFPSGSTAPNASTLNLSPGAPTPNLAIVRVGAGGKVALFNLAGSTTVIADVAGWIPTGSTQSVLREHATSEDAECCRSASLPPVVSRTMVANGSASCGRSCSSSVISNRV